MTDAWAILKQLHGFFDKAQENAKLRVFRLSSSEERLLPLFRKERKFPLSLPFHPNNGSTGSRKEKAY